MVFTFYYQSYLLLLLLMQTFRYLLRLVCLISFKKAYLYTYHLHECSISVPFITSNLMTGDRNNLKMLGSLFPISL